MAWRENAQGADALCNLIQGGPELGILIRKQLMQRAKPRPLHIPMIEMGLLIKAVGIGQNLRQRVCNNMPRVTRNASIRFHHLTPWFQ